MYYKEVNYNSNKECFEFLSNHFTYDTMNSWNGLKSIANNVKVYNLPGIDLGDALKALEEDDYFTINQIIQDWEDDHPGYKVGFNGRSAGYLVLYNNQNNNHCFHNIFYSSCFYDDYECWKRDVQECYGSLKAFHEELVFEVKLVQEFDKLCDDLIDVLKNLIKEMHDREEHTYKFKVHKSLERYTYDTKEDFERHRKYMLDMGCTIYDYDIDENIIWAEYNVSYDVEGEVVIE